MRQNLINLAAAAIIASPLAAAAQGQTDALTMDPVPQGEDITLTVWSFLPGNYEAGEEIFDRVTESFEAAHPGVTVEITEMPYGTYFDQVRNATVSRTGPDVITMYGAAQAYSYRNGLFPLQDVIDPELRDRIRFLPENYSADGNLYILPTGTYGYALLANDDIFAEAGIDPAEGLASWDALIETCGTLSEAGIEPISAGFRDGFLMETYLYMISSQLMDDEMMQQWVAGEIPMDDPVFVTVMDRIVQMRDAGCFGGDEALGRNMYDDTINRFTAGQAAMVTVGGISTADWATGGEIDSSIHPLPMVPEAEKDLMIDAGAEAGWAVTRWTEHPAAARAFVMHMASPETQAVFAELAGIPPNLEGATFEPEGEMHRNYAELMTLPGNQTTFAAFPLTVLAVVERNAVPLMSGDMDVEEYLSAAQRAARRSR